MRKASASKRTENRWAWRTITQQTTVTKNKHKNSMVMQKFPDKVKWTAGLRKKIFWCFQSVKVMYRCCQLYFTSNGDNAVFSPTQSVPLRKPLCLQEVIIFLGHIIYYESQIIHSVETFFHQIFANSILAQKTMFVHVSDLESFLHQIVVYLP